MTKTTAHWILAIFDIAAIFACYYVLHEWQSINNLIQARSDSIALQQYFTYLLLMAIVPVTHGIAFLEKYELVKKWGNRLLISLFIIVFLFSLYLGYRLDKKISTAGYNYCNLLSEQMTFTEYKVYLIKGSKCIE